MKQREDLLSDARDLFMSGVSPESAFNWILVLVPSFPKTTISVDDQFKVSKSMFIYEMRQIEYLLNVQLS